MARKEALIGDQQVDLARIDHWRRHWQRQRSAVGIQQVACRVVRLAVVGESHVEDQFPVGDRLCLGIG